MTPEQIMIVTVLVVPLLVQGFKLVLAATGKEVSRFWATVVAFVVSVGLAFWWVRPALPTTTDPMQMATEIMVIIGSVFGFATLIYNLILSKLFEVAKLTKERFLK
jgi:hypothetical protein